MRMLVLSMLAVAALLCVGCESIKGNGEDNSTSAKEVSLYDRLGGQQAVTKVVDDFVLKASTDKRVNFTRQGVPGAAWDPTPENMAKLKQGLVDFITMATNGPSNYKGKDMKEVHKNMQITEAEFDACEQDLKSALDDNRVSAQAQKELLDIVRGTKKQIVTKK